MKNARRAFTLIELLIAALIFSVILISIYSAFQTGILAYRKADSAFDVYQAARIALNRIELDLKNSFAYKAGDFQFEGRDKMMELFSLVNLYKESETNAFVCRVKYVWDENNQILKRTCQIGLDALKTDAQQEGQELANNVESITFEYAFPTGDSEKPYTWQQTWLKDDGPAEVLPLAVRIKLSLKENAAQGAETTEFVKVVPLPLGSTSASGGTPAEEGEASTGG